MGTSRDVATFTRKVTTTGKRLHELSRSDLAPAASSMSVTMLRFAAGARLRPGSMIAGKPWRGTYTKASGAKNLAVGYARGANLVDQPIRAHFITPRGAGSAKNQERYLRRTGKAKKSLRGLVAGEGGGGYKGRHGLRFGGRWSAYAHHKAQPGKHFFRRSQPAVQKAAAVEVRKKQVSIVTQGFR